MILRKVKVKICGITKLPDAIFACDAGADAIGLVFYKPSSRNVDIAMARAIADGMPPFVQRVGLFVNASAAEVRQVLENVDLDLLQFHGDEAPEYCESFNKAFIKAITMKPGLDITEKMAGYPGAKGFLLDTYHPQQPGGTGEVFNWEHFPKTANKPLILAGGLTAENVQHAIQICQPYAVDVSGGVEIDKGIKSTDKIRAFINKAKSIEVVS
jgi:phosphoribosylanthranilate isomerase